MLQKLTNAHCSVSVIYILQWWPRTAAMSARGSGKTWQQRSKERNEKQVDLSS